MLDCEGNEITDTEHIGHQNPFRYRGYFYETVAGLYYLKSRFYDPETGRFLTPDSVEYLDPETIGGLNFYAYCNNNPVMYFDPSGHSATLAIILGIIAVAGLITTGIGVATSNNLVTAIGLSAVAVPALISGGIALVGGITAGATFTAAVGGVTAIAGIGTGLFASAEYQETFTGNNWILSSGMREGLYNSLMLATASVATIGTIISAVGYSFSIKSIQGFGRYGKYGKPGYPGMKFTNAAGKTHVLTFQTHSHVVGKNISQWHWQLQKWNPYTRQAAGELGKWLWWDLSNKL